MQPIRAAIARMPERLYASRRPPIAALRTHAATFVCFLDSDDYWLPGTLAVFWTFGAAPASVRLSSVEARPWRRRPPFTATHCGRKFSGLVACGVCARRLPTQSLELGAIFAHRCWSAIFFPAIIYGDLFYLSGLIHAPRMACKAQVRSTIASATSMIGNFFHACACKETVLMWHTTDFAVTRTIDQISRRRSPTAMARRHLFITALAAASRRHARHTAGSATAFSDACYMMARALASISRRKSRTSLFIPLSAPPLQSPAVPRIAPALIRLFFPSENFTRRNSC